ncbi:MAG: response regulator [Gemmatimonadales bacterium]
MLADRSTENEHAADWRSAGLILVVDDEASIVRLATRLLTAIGFDVRTATDGAAGLRLFNETARHARLIILDRTMPGLSGDQLMTEIHRIRPELPVIISSGYLAPAEIERLQRAGAAGFVAKPYRQAELIAVVRNALGENSGRP